MKICWLNLKPLFQGTFPRGNASPALCLPFDSSIWLLNGLSNDITQQEVLWAVFLENCVICLLPLPLRVPSDDLGDELLGCRVTVGQQGAIVGPTGKGIPIDLDQARGRGRGRGQVVVGGRSSWVSPKLSLPLPHRPVPVAVWAPSQEEVGKPFCAGLRPSRPRPEEGRGRRWGWGRGSQREGGVRKGRGRSRGGLVEGGCVRAGGRLDRDSAGPATPKLGKVFPGRVDPQTHWEMELSEARTARPLHPLFLLILL